MMSRDTLRRIKAQLKTGTPPSISQTMQLLHSLTDHGLAALDELEGGASVMEQRAALKERERQIGIALDYLKDLLAPDGADHSLNEGYANRVRYTVDTIIEMVKAKGPQWNREWAHYMPRIEEEFGT